MKSLITDNFLLSNETAVKLYHNYAKNMPIIDYHCHLDPQAIAEDKHFDSIADIWLGGDHYKWRIMRTMGVDESYITGNKNPEQKFEKWAEVLPYALGNPLLQWSDLELVRYFGVTDSLTKDNWKQIYNQCNEVIAQPEFTVQNLIKKSKVTWICTTDDPIDSLVFHESIAAQENFKTAVTPTFRPDHALRINASGFVAYINKLAAVVDKQIDTFTALAEAMEQRIDYFHAHGGFISDHAFATIPYVEATNDEVNTIFQKRLAGKQVSSEEEDKYVTKLFTILATKYASLNWAMQIHIGAMRDVNTFMFHKLGSDTGFDSIGNSNYLDNLAKTFCALNDKGNLPKTILYDLNATNNDSLVTLAGCFQGEGVRSKIQVGTAWWFNDQKNGILNQLISLSSMGVLGGFVGMLTDSRSFLSYTRHEYFRRILCDLLGKWSQAGEITNDEQFLGGIIQDICYHNAYAYFNLENNPLKK